MTAPGCLLLKSLLKVLREFCWFWSETIKTFLFNFLTFISMTTTDPSPECGLKKNCLIPHYSLMSSSFYPRFSHSAPSIYRGKGQIPQSQFSTCRQFGASCWCHSNTPSLTFKTLINICFNSDNSLYFGCWLLKYTLLRDFEAEEVNCGLIIPCWVLACTLLSAAFSICLTLVRLLHKFPHRDPRLPSVCNVTTEHCRHGASCQTYGAQCTQN